MLGPFGGSMMGSGQGDLVTHIGSGWIAADQPITLSSLGAEVGDILFVSAPYPESGANRAAYSGSGWTFTDFSWGAAAPSFPVNARAGWKILDTLANVTTSTSIHGTAWALYRGPTSANLVYLTSDLNHSTRTVTLPSKAATTRAVALFCHQISTSSNATPSAGWTDRYHGMDGQNIFVFDLLDSFSPPDSGHSCEITGIAASTVCAHLVIGFELLRADP